MVEVSRKNENVHLLPSIVDVSKGTTENFLSPELRANFDSLRALQRCSEERPVEEDESPPAKRSKTGQNYQSEANSGRAYNLAVSTYCMIEDEISHMKNSIAELEALLLATENVETEHTDNFENGSVISDSEY